jgi:hypothetical protein
MSTTYVCPADESCPWRGPIHYAWVDGVDTNIEARKAVREHLSTVHPSVDPSTLYYQYMRDGVRVNGA